MNWFFPILPTVDPSRSAWNARANSKVPWDRRGWGRTAQNLPLWC